MKSELGRLNHELQAQNETIKDNEKKIKQNKVLPYLVSNIIEVLEVNPEDEEEIEGANQCGPGQSAEGQECGNQDHYQVILTFNCILNS